MNKDQFTHLYKSYHPELLAFSTKLTGDEFSAKDLLQDSAIKAYRKFDSLDSPARFKGWMNTIVYHTFINQYKRKKRRRELLNLNRHTAGLFFNTQKNRNHGLEQLKAEDIARNIDRVGPMSSEAFRMYHDGYSYREISRKLSIAMGTVKSRIHFARNKLKQMLTPHYANYQAR